MFLKKREIFSGVNILSRYRFKKCVAFYDKNTL